MRLDFAPMEGITTAAFRRLHLKYFPGVDRYYTPFLSPTKEHLFTPREQREFFPENNQGVPLVPQILTKVPADFLWAAEQLQELGYGEVNLNLGCPSGTVTAKGKGAGMLVDLSQLRRFLDEIFSKMTCFCSIKTRLGMENESEFAQILSVYNDYPLSELIIHPRIRKDFYRHPVRIEAFEQALAESKNPVSYNGSILTPQDFQTCAERYPQLRAIMIGQALISDPFLAARIRSGAATNRATLKSFHDELFDTYTHQFGSANNAAKRMKDLWFYLIRLFEGGERHIKKILKSKTAEEYTLAVQTIFQELPLLEETAGGW